MNFKEAAPDIDIIRASMEVIASDARTGKSSKLEGELAQIIMDLIDARDDPDFEVKALPPTKFHVGDPVRIKNIPLEEVGGTSHIANYIGQHCTVISVGIDLYGVLMYDGRAFFASEGMLER